MVRVAVVGLGYFSQFHLASWVAETDAQLVAATDPDPARRAWAQRSYGVDPCEDLAGVMARSPDIIDIVAPPPAHADLIRASCAPGRVLICQKPFCTSLVEARAVTEFADNHDTRIVIHENFRFQPWYRTMKAVLENRQLGQIYSARFALRPGDGRGPDAYMARQPAFQTMPRLLVHETGVHFIDLFRWLFGEVRSVYADLRRLNPAIVGEDAGLLVLDHASGVQSSFDGNRLSDHATDQPRRTMGEMVIEGEGGTLSLDGYGVVRLRPFGSQEAQVLPLVYPADDSFGGGCVAALNAHVMKALQGGGTLENEARSYLPVIALTDLAYASHEDGRRRDVDEAHSG